MRTTIRNPLMLVLGLAISMAAHAQLDPGIPVRGQSVHIEKDTAARASLQHRSIH